MRDRKKQKEAKKEEMLNLKNEWGKTDKTPVNMVRVAKGLGIIY